MLHEKHKIPTADEEKTCIVNELHRGVKLSIECILLIQMYANPISARTKVVLSVN